MINLSILKRLAAATTLAAGFIFAVGASTEVSGQRDPFAKPSFMKVRKPASTNPNAKPPKPTPPPVNYGAPPVESRIQYYMNLRAQAAAAGQPLPKVTSVLTLSEVAVTGIFKTPRGWGAMVEATPIKLSYPVYPGEKFFDGQLVAVEENRLVFRKVTKVGEGKFVASVENKPLRQYSTKSVIEGTADAAGPQSKPLETASTTPQPAALAPGTIPASRPSSNPFLSPVDEMNRMPQTPVEDASKNKDKAKKPAKKPVKVANNSKPKN